MLAHKMMQARIIATRSVSVSNGMRSEIETGLEECYCRPEEGRSEAVADARCDASEAEFLAEVLFWEGDFGVAFAAFWVELWPARAEELVDLWRVFECRDGLLITVDCSAASGR